MRLLLGTQVMLWWLLAASPCLVSVASIWEVAIKHRLGKLAATSTAFRDQSVAAGAALLPVLLRRGSWS
jgi:PIN domain nuclease of toxin-antitoxin system